METLSLLLLIAISSCIWLYRQYRRYHREKSERVWSVPISSWPEKENETPIRRYFTHVKGAMGSNSQPHAEYATLYDGLQSAVERFAQLKTLGMRRLTCTVSKPKTIVQMGPHGLEAVKRVKDVPCYSGYEWITYRDMWEEQGFVASGLRRMGIHPRQVFGTWAPTCRQNTMLFAGCIRQSISLVTVYNTLGRSGLCQALNETKASGLFLRVDQLPGLDDLVQTVPSIKLVIYFGTGEWDSACATQSQNAIENLSKHAAVISYSELLEVGRMHPIEDTKPSRQDLVGVMYTSGSTGRAKGVLLTHNSLLSSLAAIELMLLSYKKSYDLYLSYLPSSHVLEFIIQFAVLIAGVPLGYGTPYSLTDDMVSGCRGDLTELRPTLLAGVPQVWDTVRREVMHKVKSRGPRVERIFNGAVWLKWALMQAHLPAAWLDWAIFWQVQRVLGGRLRYVLSGGSSISLETQRLLSTIICPVLQGYGMTESSGVIALQQPCNACIQRVGSVVPCLDIKLVSVPEAGYHANDGEGEIYIRGTSVTPGYLNAGDTGRPIPVVESDGWLRTGDVARWHDDGQLQIIDRVKNIQKLANGEYIALEKVEGVYKTSLYAMNVCADVQPDQKRPLALVDPDPKMVAQLGQQLGYSQNRSIRDLCSDLRVRDAILQSLIQAARDNGFTRAETVFGCVIDPDGWTPENRCLTAASKLNRRKIQRKLAKEISDAYANMSQFN
ncbi:acetyl-CoA synthetase-like protein [Martensiomyces pterosporus]|nr:acetyl-CoA synthetase-like protein [Martensiomyces pterosporus]